MTDTPFVYASFAGQTSGAALASYVAQSGDVKAVFSKLHGGSSLYFGSINDLSAAPGGADSFYGAGGALSSGQTQMDLSMDVLVASTAQYVEVAGFTIGDDGSGNNYVDCRINVGSASFLGGNTNVSVYNVVGGNGSGTAIGSSGALTLSAGSTYTLQAQIRGGVGAYTINVFIGPKGGTLTEVITGLSVPSLVMPGRYVGIHQVYYLSSGSSSTNQTDSTGLHPMNFTASTYVPALTAGLVTVASTGAGTATVTTSAATNGTTPYSYQFQRALITAGTAGSYSNIGTAGTSLTYADTGTPGNAYSYRVAVTDSEGTPVTATSTATSFTYPIPSYSLATSPTSLSLVQGTSSSVVVTSAAILGYSATPTLTLAGLPTGVTGSFSPPSIAGGAGTSTLTLTAAGNAVTGTFTVVVTGTDTGGMVQTAALALTVAASVGGATLDTVNNNVLALISSVNSAVSRNTFS